MRMDENNPNPNTHPRKMRDRLKRHGANIPAFDLEGRTRAKGSAAKGGGLLHSAGDPAANLV